LYQEILSKSSIELIASGGVSNLDDLIALKKMGCSGAIIGKAIYEGKVTLKEIQELC
jgi:phosphoribosylformimino-5-aminoimidazole carboxamide ribotide isomerase